MRIPRSYKLDEATVGLLKVQGNAGRYIDAIVQRTHRRSIRALNLLLLCGWSHVEITETISALNSALDCVDDPRGHSATMTRHSPSGVPEMRWKILADDVARDMNIGFAVDLVATAWWDGNSHVREILSNGAAGEQPAKLEA